MINGHGGNVISLAGSVGCPAEEIIDMSCNLNPLGPPEGLEAFLRENIAKIRVLPQADARQMVEAFGRYYHVDCDRVLAGNGTTFFLYTLPLALDTRHMLIAGPTYSDYSDGCMMHDRPFSFCMADNHSGFVHDLDAVSDQLSDKRYGFDTAVFCNPNNPTGQLIKKIDLLNLIQAHRKINFIVDESYLPFSDNADETSLVGENRFPNLIVLSSMSKIFRIPGLRTGFLCAHPAVIQRMMKYYQPWTVNALAQAAIVHIFENHHLIEPFIRETRAFIKSEKDRFCDLLTRVKGIELFPSETYFILARLTAHGMTSEGFCRSVGRGKILIRDCSNFKGLSDRYVRFSLASRQWNRKLAGQIARSMGLLTND